MKSFNINMTKICAFCKHWFDPASSAIKPKVGGFYEIDDRAKRKCTKCSLDKNAICCCPKFERKR